VFEPAVDQVLPDTKCGDGGCCWITAPRSAVIEDDRITDTEDGIDILDEIGEPSFKRLLRRCRIVEQDVVSEEGVLVDIGFGTVFVFELEVVCRFGDRPIGV